jgi:signal transduction histidine kinase
MTLVDRLAALPSLAKIPLGELEWLVTHGELERHEAGTIVARKGEPIERLWIILSGHLAIRVDRGAGPRRVMEWRVGDVSGMLPFSRMTGAPGSSYVEETSEVLGIHQRHFPEMIHRCPVFTAHTVHHMIDRARSFNTSDLQDEKMISLGKLAAGLAHELNNPASATVRSAKLLLAGLAETDAASRALGAAGLTQEQLETIERTRAACVAQPAGAVLSPIRQADREDAITDWLERHGSDPAHASPLAETAVTIETLDRLASAMSGDTLDAALRWIAAGCATHSLARDIERAATRIHELVAAVKKFTYMDNLAAPESVDVEAGLRDTMRVVAAKAKSKGAAVTLDVAPELPRAHATGGELNQVWLNLIDNALDAIAESGHIEISARAELDRVVVRVVDDGPGIPPDVLPKIFDPFFTTKPPGQGTGLGLDIARRLLRRYHGDISIESRPGRTEFRVSLVTDHAAGAGSGQPGAKRAGD